MKIENKAYWITFVISFVLFIINLIFINEESKIYSFINSLSSGVIAACILYFIVELIPEKNKKEKVFRSS